MNLGPDNRDREANQEMPAKEKLRLAFIEKWNEGTKIEAMEIIMGRYINAKDLSGNPDLATIFMQPSAEEAYAAALLVLALEQMAQEK